MALFDWNRNGKIDAQDMFLEYNIFKAALKMKMKMKTYLIQMTTLRNIMNFLMTWMKNKI